MDASHSTTSHPNKNNAFVFHGKSGEYFSIWLVNILLSIITLGVYSAWATVRNKRYFYGNLELDGDRFDYHARPVQILLGRMLVIFSLIVTYVLLIILPPVGAALLIVFALLLPWIIIRSWRFDAIMSSYRGVRFNYECRTGRAYWVLLGFPLVTVVGLVVLYSLINSLLLFSFREFMVVMVLSGTVLIFALIGALIAFSGIATAMRYDLYVNNMYFGNQKFTAVLSKKKFVKMALVSSLIFVPFVVLIFAMILISFGSLLAAPEDIAMLAATNMFLFSSVYLLLLVAALCVACYLFVAQRNYLFSQTTLCDGQIALRSSMRGGAYLGLVITNTLLVIFTLGLGSPAAHIRHARYVAEHTHVEGDMTLASVKAHSDSAGVAVAEEMVQALDLNLGI